jgi:hypothetical protein
MTAATIEKSRAARKRQAKAPGVGGTKLRQLSQMLWDASQSDGDFSSGYSLRLLRVASEVALEAADSFDSLHPDAQVDMGFDLAALVSAARRVPKDQPMPSALTALIARAHSLLNELTDCEDCFDDGPAASATPSAPFLNGYTPTQLRDILGHMACSCISATELMLDVSVNVGGGDWSPSQCKTALHAVSQTVSLIGAMADQAAGTNIMGGPIEWSMGDRDMKGAVHG